jgi:hypothetical protein
MIRKSVKRFSEKIMRKQKAGGRVLAAIMRRPEQDREKSGLLKDKQQALGALAAQVQKGLEKTSRGHEPEPPICLATR